MKDFYKINEIARLYGVCADTLRYYEEQGILSPKRDSNNYRLYSIQDICNLNIIRTLRGLDVPTEKIRDYIRGRTVESTLVFLSEEEELINHRIDELRRLRKSVRSRIEKLRVASTLPVGAFRLLELDPRPSFRLSENVILEEEIDFLLKRLEHKHESELHLLGNRQMGATVNMEYVQKGIYNHFSHVFFVGGSIKGCDAVIPGGRYASTVYSGRYEHLADALPRLLDYVKSQGFTADGPPMELYHIDTHETRLQEEYLTEVQVKIREK